MKHNVRSSVRKNIRRRKVKREREAFKNKEKK